MPSRPSSPPPYGSTVRSSGRDRKTPSPERQTRYGFDIARSAAFCDNLSLSISAEAPAREDQNERDQRLSRPRLLQPHDQARCRAAARDDHRKFLGRAARSQRRAPRPAPDLAVQRRLQNRGVPEPRALADAEPRRARRARASADRKLLRRP